MTGLCFWHRLVQEFAVDICLKIDLPMIILISQGTIEEKVYQRQICKQGLSGSVIDVREKKEAQFSLDDLRVSHANKLTMIASNCSDKASPGASVKLDQDIS